MDQKECNHQWVGPAGAPKICKKCGKDSLDFYRGLDNLTEIMAKDRGRIVQLTEELAEVKSYIADKYINSTKELAELREELAELKKELADKAEVNIKIALDDKLKVVQDSSIDTVSEMEDQLLQEDSGSSSKFSYSASSIDCVGRACEGCEEEDTCAARRSQDSSFRPVCFGTYYHRSDCSDCKLEKECSEAFDRFLKAAHP